MSSGSGRPSNDSIAADPGDSAAYDRLAELADKGGKSLDAAEWRRKRTEIDQIKARYQKRFERNQPLRDAIEMAPISRAARPLV